MAATPPLLALDGSVLLHVLSFLKGNDALRLQSTCRELNSFVDKKEDFVYRRHLVQDFPEGRLVVEAFERRAATACDASYKEKYLAFLHRWSVQESFEGEHMAIPWRPPSSNADEDLDGLEYIVRVWDRPESCAFLEWRKASDPWQEESDEDIRDYLGIDEEWYEKADHSLHLPPLKNEIRQKMDALEEHEDLDLVDKIKQHMCATYRISLNVVNVETCQVLTLIDDAPAQEIEGLYTTYANVFGHADDVPTFYGLPNKGSPFFRRYTQGDLAEMLLDGHALLDGRIETLSLFSCLELQGFSDDHLLDIEKKHVDTFSLERRLEFVPCPDDSTICKRHGMSSFFRALIQERCLDLGVTALKSEQSSLDMSIILEEPQQPAWVEKKEVLDRILSFSPFEEQTTSLRLVCKAFNTSALAQVESKLLDQDWLPIAFYRSDAASWVRVDARRGWSEGMDSRDAVIDEALQMFSCRCIGKCQGRAECPQRVPSFSVGRVTKELNLPQARRLLNEKGFLYLTSNFPKGQRGFPPRPDQNSLVVSFDVKEGKSLYQVCGKLHKAIKKEVECYALPNNLKTHWGLLQNMSSKRFLRSLFLVFTDGIEKTQGHFPQVTVAKATSQVNDAEGALHCQSKTIYRFLTAGNNQPIEICMESRRYV